MSNYELILQMSYESSRIAGVAFRVHSNTKLRSFRFVFISKYIGKIYSFSYSFTTTIFFSTTMFSAQNMKKLYMCQKILEFLQLYSMSKKIAAGFEKSCVFDITLFVVDFIWKTSHFEVK